MRRRGGFGEFYDRFGRPLVEASGTVPDLGRMGVATVTNLARGAAEGDPLKHIRLKERPSPDLLTTILTGGVAGVVPQIDQTSAADVALGGIGQIPAAVTGERDVTAPIEEFIPQRGPGDDVEARRRFARGNPGIAMAEAVGVPVAHLAMEAGTDPSLAAMTALGAAANAGTKIPAAVQGAGGAAAAVARGLPGVVPPQLPGAVRAATAAAGGAATTIPATRTAAAGIMSGVLSPEAQEAAFAVLRRAGRFEAAERLLGASFIPGMAQGAVESAAHAVDTARERGVSDPETVQAGLEAGAAGVFAGLGARAAFHPSAVPTVRPEDIPRDAAMPHPEGAYTVEGQAVPDWWWIRREQMGNGAMPPERGLPPAPPRLPGAPAGSAAPPAPPPPATRPPSGFLEAAEIARRAGRPQAAAELEAGPERLLPAPPPAELPASLPVPGEPAGLPPGPAGPRLLGPGPAPELAPEPVAPSTAAPPKEAPPARPRGPWKVGYDSQLGGWKAINEETREERPARSRTAARGMADRLNAPPKEGLRRPEFTEGLPARAATELPGGPEGGYTRGGGAPDLGPREEAIIPAREPGKVARPGLSDAEFSRLLANERAAREAGGNEAEKAWEDRQSEEAPKKLNDYVELLPGVPEGERATGRGFEDAAEKFVDDVYRKLPEGAHLPEGVRQAEEAIRELVKTVPEEAQPTVLAEAVHRLSSRIAGRDYIEQARAKYGDSGPDGVQVIENVGGRDGVFAFVQRHDGRVVGAASGIPGIGRLMVAGGPKLGSPVSARPLYEAMNKAGIEPSDVVSSYGRKAQERQNARGLPEEPEAAGVGGAKPRDEGGVPEAAGGVPVPPEAPQEEVAPRPEPKVTPQVPHGVGGPEAKYVLPSFVTEPHRRPADHMDGLDHVKEHPEDDYAPAPSAPGEKGPGEVHRYASTQVDLPAPLAERIRRLRTIPDADLFFEEDGDGGREKNPHVTVKYGIHGNDVAPIRALLEKEPPVRVKLGKTGFFPAAKEGKGDTVYLKVDSPDLHRLNGLIADNVDVTDTHPTYEPHVTVAYVKPGLGKKYAGKDWGLKGSVTIDRVTFGAKDGTTHEIMLGGAAPAARARAESPLTEAPNESTVQEESPNVGSDVPGPEPAERPRREDQGALEEPPPGPVAEAPVAEPAPEGLEEGGRPDGGGVPGAPGGGRPVGGPSVGSGEGEVRLPSTGQEGPGAPVRPARAVRDRGTDYRITDADEIGAGGAVGKARGNLEALRTLKTILDEKRAAATPEEQAKLVKYVGWGGLPQVFERYTGDKTLRELGAELEQLVGHEEYEAARRSTLNAHYTSPDVVRATWDAIQRLGVPAGASVLEPATGVGHFLGLQPEAMLPAPRYGVELDKLTGQIARLLYPNAAITIKGFQEAKLPKNHFDVVVSNVPFGKLIVNDKTYQKSPEVLRAIHNYYFAKALDLVHPGGVVAFITSHFTLDAKDPAVRKYIAARADLLGAIRLPSSAFKAGAGTEVVTDILFLRRRPEGATPAGEPFQDVKGIGGKIEHNEYFAAHPEMILGKPSLEGSMYGRGSEEYTVKGEVTPAALAERVAKLPEGAFTAEEHPVEEPKVFDIAPNEMKEGSYSLAEGGLVQKVGDSLVPVKAAPARLAQMKGLIGVRDALKELIRQELSDVSDEDIAAQRKAMGAAYDAHVKKYGPLWQKENRLLFKSDPDAPLLLALEDYDPKDNKATKAPIFTSRTIARYTPPSSAGSPEEALTISLGERGRIDLARMSALTGKSKAQLAETLAAKGLIFRNPDGQQWETREEYLSGPVRKKLEVAKRAARGNHDYEANVEALKAAQPEDLPPSQIRARLGAAWIDPTDVADFSRHILSMPGWALNQIQIHHNKVAALWSAKGPHTTAATEEWGTKRASFWDLLEDSLNLKQTQVWDRGQGDTRVINATETTAAQEKQGKIKEAFEKWVWQDEDRAARLARVYNDTFNDSTPRIYSGEHLVLPGMARTVLRGGDLMPHQKAAVWRAITLRPGEGLLLNQAVGAGKTFEMAATAMELRRLGLAKKPLVVVPNHLVSEFAAQLMRLYPQAKVLILDKPDWEKGKRQQAMSRIATGDWDTVVVPHSSFKLLPVHGDTLKSFMEEEIAAVQTALEEAAAAGEKRSPTVKQLEKMKANMEARMQRLLLTTKDNTITFEELGVDLMMVDEAHAYKKIQIPTRAQVAGIAREGSQRAEDMLVKTKWLSRRGGRTIFATATPITNTMGEVYVMQRFLQPQLLEEAGISNFDAWRATFGETQQSVELSVDGRTYKPKERFSKFVNTPELGRMFARSTQTNLASDLKLPTPKMKGGKAVIHVVEPTKEQAAYQNLLVRRAAEAAKRHGPPEPGQDNILVITMDGRKAATDMRLIDSRFADQEGTKINEVVDTIAEIYHRSEIKKERGTQLVFLDLSTPKEQAGKEKETEADDDAAAEGEDADTETKEEAAQAVELYADMRKKLVKKGLKAEEVRFIHEAKTRAAMAQLFADMNSGRARVLIASSAKGGVGMNVQKRLYAIHHIDAPWRPDEMEQRNGRIFRQGNSWPEVEEHRYVTKRSMDAFQWQTLERKHAFITDFMRADPTVREVEDTGVVTLSADEMKAAASGRPEIMEKVVVDGQLRKAQALERAFRDSQHSRARDIRVAKDQLKANRDALVRLEEQEAEIEAARTKLGKDYSIKVGKKTYADREEAGTALHKAVVEMDGGAPDTAAVVGERLGQKILVRLGREMKNGKISSTPTVYVGGVEFSLNPDSPTGTIQSMEAALRKVPANVEQTKGWISGGEARIRELERIQAQPFEHQEQITALQKREKELRAILSGQENLSPDEIARRKEEAKDTRALAAWLEARGHRVPESLTEPGAVPEPEPEPEPTAALSTPKSVDDYVIAFDKNANEYHDRTIDYDQFQEQQKALWAEAAAAGLTKKVGDALRTSGGGHAELPPIPRGHGAPPKEPPKPPTAAPAADAPEPPGEGSEVKPGPKKVFNREAAKERLNGRGKGKAHDLGSAAAQGAGVMGDLAEIGASFLEDGVRKFGDWSKAMADFLGDTVRNLGRALSELYRRAVQAFSKQPRPQATAGQGATAGGRATPGGPAGAAPPPGGKGAAKGAGQAPQGGRPPLPVETLADKVARIFQDQTRRIETVEKAVSGIGKGIHDAFAAVRSKTAAIQQRAANDFVRPLVEEMARGKIELRDLDDYMALLHKPVRDAEVGRRSQGTNLEGSGWTKAEADARWAELEAKFGARAGGKIAGLEDAANFVRGMRDEQFRIAKDGGLLSNAQIAELKKTWGADYVPLKTFEVESGIDGLTGQGSGGRGFEVRGKEHRQAHGRGQGDHADSPVSHMIEQLMRTISRAEKNKADQRFAQWVQQHNVFDVDKSYTHQVLDSQGHSRTVRDTLREQQDYGYKVDGVQHRIDIAEADPLLDRALRNMAAQQMEGFIGRVANLTRRFASLATSKNPFFMFTNLPRDLQAALINVSAEHPAVVGKVLKGIAPAVKAMFQWSRDQNRTGAIFDRIREFKESGGSIGWSQVKSAREIAQGLEAELRTAGPGAANAAKRAFRGLGDFIGSANDSVENATRFAVYNALRDSGVTAEKAAHAARNVTLDFTKRGEAGPVMNALYAFFNANVQGVKRLKEVAIDNPRGRLIVGALAGAGMAMDAYNRAQGGDSNKDGTPDYDEIPEFLKAKNFVIMRGEGERPIMIPMPYGFNIFHTIGRHVMSTIQGQETPAKAALGVGNALENAFNPLGGEAGFVQSITPTVLDPFVQHATNETWTGRQLKPEPFPGSARKPESEMFYRGVSPTAKAVARFLNEATGGDSITPGWLSVSPEVLAHYADAANSYFTGGAGRGALQLGEAGLELAKGETPALRQIPVARSYLYERGPAVSGQAYRDNAQALQDAWGRRQKYLQAGDTAKAAAIPVSLLRAKKLFDAADRQIAWLKKRPMDEKERDRQIQAVQDRANRAYSQARR